MFVSARSVFASDPDRHSPRRYPATRKSCCSRTRQGHPVVGDSCRRSSSRTDPMPLEDASMAPPAPMFHLVVFVSVVFTPRSRAPEPAARSARSHIPILPGHSHQFKNRCTSSGQVLFARTHNPQHALGLVPAQDNVRALLEQALRHNQNDVLQDRT